jgi:hypothetical protein
MSRYQLVQTGWSIGAVFVPPGSVIDDVAGQDDFSKLVRTRGLSPPLNAQPLDQASWNTMKALYGGGSKFLPPDAVNVDLTPWIVTGPDITR